MNTYLFQNDNNIVLTECTGGIVEKSNSIDTFRIIMPKDYHGFDMSTFDCVVEYKLPISNTNGMIVMTMADSAYKDDYVLWTLPNTTMTTELTAECGQVEFSVHCMKAELDEEGNTIERVRQSAAPSFIKILPISTWISPSERALSSLASLYLENKKLALALQASAEALSATKIDDIKIDLENEKLIGTANGQEVGVGVDLATLNQELVLLGGSSADSGNISIQRI